MPIPNAHLAFVPPEKLSDYLLNVAHAIGGSKARWFISLGYDPIDPAELEADLLGIVRSSSNFVAQQTQFGVKYIVRGWINAPNGSRASLRTVWITVVGMPEPRFVTAYPEKK